MSRADYDKWIKEANAGADLPLDVLGEKVYTTKGCNTCHSTDGSVKTGPTWKGVFGSLEKLESLGDFPPLNIEQHRDTISRWLQTI